MLAGARFSTATSPSLPTYPRRAALVSCTVGPTADTLPYLPHAVHRIRGKHLFVMSYGAKVVVTRDVRSTEDARKSRAGTGSRRIDGEDLGVGPGAEHK